MGDILADVQSFFEDNIPLKPFSDEENEEYNRAFLDFLHENYEEEVIDFYLEDIQKYIREYFHDIGRVLFKYNYQRGMFFKLYTYEINPIYSKHYKTLLEILDKHSSRIQYPYQGRNDQIAILDDLKTMMELEIANSSEVGDKKELFRVCIRESLKLSERDIILFLKDKIIIKIFQKLDNLNTDAGDPAKRDSTEQRYGGFDPIELENYYEELFGTVSIDEFIDELLQELFKKEINFNRISNAYFEQNAITIINKAVADKLENIIEEDGDFIAGFAGFVFRKHFFRIFEQIAIKLLKEIATDNAHAKKFLSYYSGEVVFEKGKKYLLPSIVTDDGRRWNISSVIVISKTWLSAENTKHRTRQRLEDAKLSLEASTKEWSAASDIYNELKEQKDLMIEDLQEIYRKVDDAMRDMRLSKATEPEKNKIREKIKNYTKEEDIINRKKADLEIKIKDAYHKSLHLHKKYKEDDKAVKDLTTKLHLLELRQKESNKDYKNFLVILVKALTKRKKLLR